MAKPIRPGYAAHKLPQEEIHRMVAEAVQKTGVTNPVEWVTNKKPVVQGRSLRNLFDILYRRKVDGKRFLGYETLEAYLKAKHSVSTLTGQRWSDERIHRTIAAMAEKHPPKKINWSKQFSPTGTWDAEGKKNKKSLNALQTLARRSNQPPGKTTTPYFGQGTFKTYAKWAVENYGTKSKYYKKAQRGE